MKEQTKNTGWIRLVAIIIPYLIIVGAFQLFGAYLVGFNYEDSLLPKTAEQQLIIQFFTFLGTCLVVWLFVRFVDKEEFVAIGLRIKNKFKEFWIGFLIGFIIMVLGFGLLQSLDEIQYQGFEFNLTKIILSVLLFLLVALTEEILFRGYILRNLMYSYNKYLALLISSVIFSLVHGFNPNIDIIGFTNIFLSGILLGITYIHTKNLWFPIALHFSWNFFQTALGFNVSGQNTFSVVQISREENTVLNGGSFGFEGSILSLIAIVIVLIVITTYYKRKKLNIKTVTINNG